VRQNRQYLFDKTYLEVFGVLTGVGVDASKFFGVGAGVLKCGAGAESESEKCDSTHLCRTPSTARIRWDISEAWFCCRCILLWHSDEFVLLPCFNTRPDILQFWTAVSWRGVHFPPIS